jgi:hypothetical protein
MCSDIWAESVELGRLTDSAFHLVETVSKQMLDGSLLVALLKLTMVEIT